MQTWPDAVPFDPEIGAGSPVLEALIAGPAAALSAVLLIVGDRARASGFGPAAAFAIADAWSRADRTPVLADLGFEDPTLHSLLGASNDEGIADAFAFGTSLRRLWRSIDDRSFSFLAAGYAPDAAEIRASGDWRRIIAQESATGHTLLLYAPANADGIDLLAGKVGAVIVIAEEEDLPAAADSLPRPYAIVAVLTPHRVTAPVVDDASTVDTSGISPVADAPPELLAADLPAASEDTRPAYRSAPLIVDDESEVERAESGDSSLASRADFERIRVPREGAGREELIADLRSRQRAALMAPPADSDGVAGRRGEWGSSGSAPAGAADTTIDHLNRRGALADRPRDERAVSPPAHVRVPREETPTGTLPGEPPILVLANDPLAKVRRFQIPRWLMTLAVFVVVGGSAAWYVYQRATATPVEPVLQPTTAIPPFDSLAMVPLPYVVAIEAHTQLKTALDRQLSLARTETGTHFFVAPLVRGDVQYYHLFAGPLRDSAKAVIALDALLAHKVKTGAATGDVRQVPLSFLIDHFASEKEAAARVEELRKTGIPAFIVSGDVNRVTQWQVYAGAYAGPAEADVMRTLLKGAGVKDSLVTRTGRSIQ